MEQFFIMGTWKGMWKRPTLQIYGSTLTIPRGFDTCRGATSIDRCHPFQLYSEFHRFAGYGPYYYNPSYYGWTMNNGWYGWPLTLINESAQTFVIPTGTFTLRVVGTENANPGFTFSGGFDQDGNEIFTSESVDISNGTTNGTTQYTVLPGIQKVVTQNKVQLYSVDTTSTVATLVGVYAPGETIPSYRQYSVSCDTALDGTLVRAICKLGFSPAVANNDLIIPDKIRAYELGLQALQFESKVDPVNAGLYWGPNWTQGSQRSVMGKMAGAIDLLDADIAELDSAEQPVFNVEQDYAAGAVINVM